MPDRASPTQLARDATIGFRLGLIAAMAVFLVSGGVAYYNIRTLSVDGGWVNHSHEVLQALGDALSLVKDAETGQRGYLITGDERYLQPHTEAVARIDEQIADLQRLVSDNPAQLARIPS